MSVKRQIGPLSNYVYKIVKPKLVNFIKFSKPFFGQNNVKAVISQTTGTEKDNPKEKGKKIRYQDLKNHGKKKDKQRRIREKVLRKENSGLPDWLE